MNKSIERLYALIAEDEGEYGIVAFSDNTYMFPMVGTDLARAASLEKIAQTIATRTGKPIKLCVFSQREHIKPIKP